VQIWDTSTQQLLLAIKDGSQRRESYKSGGNRGMDTLLLYKNGQGVHMAFSPDGTRLAKANKNGDVRVWNALTGEELLTFLDPDESYPMCVTFSADGKRLACGDSEGVVKIWDADQGQRGFTLQQATGGVMRLLISPNRKRLAGEMDDGAIQVWDAETGRVVLGIPTLKGKAGFFRNLTFSPDGRRLAAGASANGKGVFHVWDAQTGEVLRTGNWRPPRGVDSVAFSPDGKRLATSHQLQEVKVWDAETGQDLLTLKSKSTIVESLTFSPDGKLLACGDSKSLNIWDGATGKPVHVFESQQDIIHHVVFSPNGKRLVSSSHDGTAKVWDAATAANIFTLKHKECVNCSAFTPDGKRLLTLASNGVLTVWDAATGQEMARFPSPPGGTSCLNFQDDGRRLAVSSGGAAEIWETAAGKDVHTLKGLAGKVSGVTFSADGARILAKDEKGAQVTWDAVSGLPIAAAGDPPPPDGQLEAFNPERTLRARARRNTVLVVDPNDPRPTSAYVFGAVLSDVSRQVRWHREEAATAECKGEWFAAAHHLKYLLLLADPACDQGALAVRRLRAATLLNASDDKPLRPAAAQSADRAGDAERVLAGLHHRLDWPRHQLPSWLKPEIQSAVLAGVRAAEERLLASPAR
jgi:WD40 repeat protein